MVMGDERGEEWAYLTNMRYGDKSVRSVFRSGVNGDRSGDPHSDCHS